MRLFVILLVLYPCFLNAQVFSVITNPSGATKAGSTPSNYLTIGTVTYFTADNGINGVELWKTDGTAGGTVMVKDINPGMSSSSPYYLTDLNGVLMFAANNGTTGAELWRSDGTENGTYMVLDVSPGTGSGMPKGINPNDKGKDSYTPAVIGSVMYFMGSNNATGREVWKTDGTETGTVILKDIFQSGSLYYAGNGLFSVLNGTLYFLYFGGGSAGFQVWKTDGTSDGTVKVTTQGLFGASMYAAVTTNYIYFCDDQTIFRFDGSALMTAASFSTINGKTLTAIGSFIYFAAESSSNTQGVELYNNGGGNYTGVNINAGAGSSSPSGFTQAGTDVYFTAYTGSTGRELWKMTPNNTGAVLVTDFYTGANNGFTAGNNLFSIDNTLYFSAEDGTSGTELWSTDGTAQGTSIVKEIAAGGYGSFPSQLIQANNGFIFSATDGDHGIEIWQSDGTGIGTTMLKDIRDNLYEVAESTVSSAATAYADINGTLYFSNSDRQNGTELWKSEGTSASTTLVKDIFPGNQNAVPGSFTEANGSIFFTATTELGTELWKTDGTAGNTVLVKDIQPGDGSSNLGNFCDVNGTLFFSADQGNNQFGLWKTDGSTAGTVLLKAINPGNSFAGAFLFTEYNNNLLFGASENILYGQELWRSDGTGAGTTIVKDLNPGTGTGMLAGATVKPVVMNNTMYYLGATNSEGWELCRSDGTEPGTYIVKDIYPGTTNSGAAYFKKINGKLFFAATTAAAGAELWISDGTEAGTTIVKDINPGTTGSAIINIVSLADRAVFAATSAAGKELWISDGTEAGTMMIKDINPGANSSNPSSLVTVGAYVYFYAGDGTGGFDIWRTDGTEQGTEIVSEIENNSGSSAAYPLILSGTHLYAIANTALRGLQLWSADVSSLVDFIFVNAGNASDAANWSGNTVPPNPVPPGVEIFINAPCTFTGNLILLDGAKLTVQTGIPFIITGNLIVE